MRAPSIALMFWAAATSFATAQQLTYNAAALPSQNVWTNGVELADVDGDLDLDILFANGSAYGGAGGAEAQHLFLNNGNGTFTAAHANLNVANFDALMVIAEDLDGDGDNDLVYAPSGPFPATTQKPRLLINNGSGVFTDKSATNLPSTTLDSFCVCAGDVDDDGDLDLVFTDGASLGGTAAQSHLFLNDGSAVFTDATATNLPADTFNAQDVILLDFDGDFDVDIAQSGKGGAGKRSRLWKNDGSGHFAIDSVMNTVGTSGTYEIDWGDLDGDGDLDAAVQSLVLDNEGWARNNSGASVSVFQFSGANGDDDNEMAEFDYDNDGDLDVVVASLASTEKVYRNDSGTFNRVTGVIAAQADATLDLAIGDVNGDGRYDIVTAQGEAPSFLDKVYVNNGSVDTLDPVAMALETPSIATPATKFHAQLRDAINDDGHVNVTARFVAATKDAAAGTLASGNATHMGTGLFRAPVPTGATTTWEQLAWIAKDSAGNVTHFGPITIGGTSTWSDLGNAKAGAKGLPELFGVGHLSSGTPGSMNLVSARASSAAMLFVSLASSPVPLAGGTLVAYPQILALPLATNTAGELTLPFTWPSGIPAGTNVFAQFVIADAAATAGAAFSNAVMLTAR